MIKGIFMIVMISFVTASGYGGSDEPSVKVFKRRGSIQCESNGTAPDVMQNELTSAGIAVLSFSCGTDGLGHAAVCGGLDDRINIFEIPQSKVAQAQSLGFSSLRSLPHAHETPCR